MTKEASDSAKRSSSESKSSKDESGFGAFGAFSALGSGPGKAMDFAKKLLTVGMGTAFLTEEALRALVTEFKIPKELIGGLLESATTARKEFIQNFTAEMISKVSERVDPKVFMNDLISEFLRKNEVSLEVKVKVRKLPPDDADQ